MSIGETLIKINVIDYIVYQRKRRRHSLEKTEGKKTVVVIDEQGNKLESTYPKRAKGLIKNGRAQYVDENTICLVDLPKNKILEENKMNNNNINLEENKKVEIDSVYIMSKIDEIVAMNRRAIETADFNLQMPVPKHPIQAICETNNKLIEFLKDIYKSLQPVKSNTTEGILHALTKALEEAIDMEAGSEIIQSLVSNIVKLKEE